MIPEFEGGWALVSGLLLLLAMLVAAMHVILTKRDPRAAVGWVGLIWFAPLLGILMYWLIGINRIQRRAREEMAGAPRLPPPAHRYAVPPESLKPLLPEKRRHLMVLAEAVRQISDRPLLSGNAVVPLVNGDEAYPAMLGEIERAERSITLMTFIFDNDPVGRRFCDALAAARARGVEVRVLIDAMGIRYTIPTILGRLRRADVTTALSMPTRVPWRMRYMNLRNHRKLMVVDGRAAFTGGMNIRQGHELRNNPPHPVKDLHFRLDGPVVAELQQVFAQDWLHATGERLEGPLWFPPIEQEGGAMTRVVTDGPDDDYDKIRWVLLSALAVAQKSICIVTPYFLPDAQLVSALNTAALRGVNVEILMPELNNLRYVQWASLAVLPQVLEHGTSAWLLPGDFDHTKAVVVDDIWVFLGSANWDPRSLKLNWELNVEVYSRKLAARIEETLKGRRKFAREVRREELLARPLWQRLRDGTAALFSPYL